MGCLNVITINSLLYIYIIIIIITMQADTCKQHLITMWSSIVHIVRNIDCNIRHKRIIVVKWIWITLIYSKSKIHKMEPWSAFHEIVIHTNSPTSNWNVCIKLNLPHVKKMSVSLYLWLFRKTIPQCFLRSFPCPIFLSLSWQWGSFLVSSFAYLKDSIQIKNHFGNDYVNQTPSDIIVLLIYSGWADYRILAAIVHWKVLALFVWRKISQSKHLPSRRQDIEIMTDKNEISCQI